jgi:hypothetical protein
VTLVHFARVLERVLRGDRHKSIQCRIMSVHSSEKKLHELGGRKLTVSPETDQLTGGKFVR